MQVNSAHTRVEIEIDGEQREFMLALNLEAMLVLADMWKVPYHQLGSKFPEIEKNPRMLYDVVHAGLIGVDEKATRKQAMELVKAMPMTELMNLSNRLIHGNQPPTEGGKTGPRNRPRR